MKFAKIAVLSLLSLSVSAFAADESSGSFPGAAGSDLTFSRGANELSIQSKDFIATVQCLSRTPVTLAELKAIVGTPSADVEKALAAKQSQSKEPDSLAAAINAIKSEADQLHINELASFMEKQSKSSSVDRRLSTHFSNMCKINNFLTNYYATSDAAVIKSDKKNRGVGPAGTEGNPGN